MSFFLLYYGKYSLGHIGSFFSKRMHVDPYTYTVYTIHWLLPHQRFDDRLGFNLEISFLAMPWALCPILTQIWASCYMYK
jgi:hypothetical protein